MSMRPCLSNHSSSSRSPDVGCCQNQSLCAPVVMGLGKSACATPCCQQQSCSSRCPTIAHVAGTRYVSHMDMRFLLMLISFRMRSSCLVDKSRWAAPHANSKSMLMVNTPLSKFMRPRQTTSTDGGVPFAVLGVTEHADHRGARGRKRTACSLMIGGKGRCPGFCRSVQATVSGLRPLHHERRVSKLQQRHRSKPGIPLHQSQGQPPNEALFDGTIGWEKAVNPAVEPSRRLCPRGTSRCNRTSGPPAAECSSPS